MHPRAAQGHTSLSSAISPDTPRLSLLSPGCPCPSPPPPPITLRLHSPKRSCRGAAGNPHLPQTHVAQEPSNTPDPAGSILGETLGPEARQRKPESLLPALSRALLLQHHPETPPASRKTQLCFYLKNKKKPFSASCWHHIKALRTGGLFLAPCRILAAPGASTAPVGSSRCVVSELGRFGGAGTGPGAVEPQSASSPGNTSANKGVKFTIKCLGCRDFQKSQRGKKNSQKFPRGERKPSKNLRGEKKFPKIPEGKKTFQKSQREKKNFQKSQRGEKNSQNPRGEKKNFQKPQRGKKKLPKIPDGKKKFPKIPEGKSPSCWCY